MIVRTGIFFFLYFFCIQFGRSQSGYPDLSFGSFGKIVTQVNENFKCDEIVYQVDGKILVGGFVQVNINESDPAVTRYNCDGRLDTSFGSGGIAILDLEDEEKTCRVTCIAIQPDAKIVISAKVGNLFCAIVRLDADGNMDTGFGNNGMIKINAEKPIMKGFILVQNDAKILCFGISQNDCFLFRYNKDGSLDANFGNNGSIKESGYFTGIYNLPFALQSDGKIIVGLSDAKPNALIRYNIDGSRDALFGEGGKLDIDNSILSIAVQEDGKIIIVKATDIPLKPELVRFNPDGSMDDTFGDHGKVNTQASYNIYMFHPPLVQENGKILVTGFKQMQMFILSYNKDGTVDTTFGVNGGVPVGLSLQNYIMGPLNKQPDGKIMIGVDGDKEFIVQRYNGISNNNISTSCNNHLQSSTDPSGLLKVTVVGPFKNAFFQLIDSTGKVIIKKNRITGSSFTFVASRLSRGAYIIEMSEDGHIARTSWVME
jgi:uncharacterized delta-60 repeat protein